MLRTVMPALSGRRRRLTFFVFTFARLLGGHTGNKLTGLACSLQVRPRTKPLNPLEPWCRGLSELRHKLPQTLKQPFGHAVWADLTSSILTFARLLGGKA
jgi:hypothetical protein